MEKLILWILTTFILVIYVQKTSCDGCYYFETQHGSIECFNTTSTDFKRFQKHFHQNNLTQMKITHGKLTHLVSGFFINGWARNMNRSILKNDLHVLDLSHNHIEIIDVNAFYGLTNLVSLNLEHNQLKTIDLEVFDDLKQNLIILNLSHNQLTYIDGDILTLFLNLRCLRLNNNKIHVIYMNQVNLLAVRLEELNFSHNSLQKFPSNAIKILYKLQKLNLAHNNLNLFNYVFLNDSRIDYTQDFYPLSELRELYINNNELLDFNIDKLRYLKNLKFIQIQGNQFTCARHEEILKEFINFRVNVTLTDDIMFSPFMCVEQQPHTNENGGATFFQRNKGDILMIIEFTLAALVVLIPVVIIVYIVKFIYFRIGDDDDLELRPFQ